MTALGNAGGIAGQRVTRFSILNTVKFALLCSVSALGSAASADNNCSSGTYKVTCTGNQSTGIVDGSKNVEGVKDLVIQSLNTDITPAAGVEGVLHYAKSGKDITQIKVTSDLGAYSIKTQGDHAHGIKLGGTGEDDSNEDHKLAHVILSHSGNISTAANFGHGIWAFSAGGDGTSHSGGSPAKSNFDIGISTPNGTWIHTDRTAIGARGVYVEGYGGAGATGATGGNGGNGGAGPSFRYDEAKLADGSVSATGGVFSTGVVTIVTEGAGQGDSGTPTNGAEGLYIVGYGGAGGEGGKGDEQYADGVYAYGPGGDGGAGGDAGYGGYSWQIGTYDQGSWNVTTKGIYAGAYRIEARGGAGGKGGEPQASNKGGKGGAGGTGAEMLVWYNNPNGSYVNGTTSGDYSPGLWVLSQGGNGGNGGSGNGGTGGSGRHGGDAGAILLGTDPLHLVVSTAGDASPGVHLHSDGGNGGNGHSGGSGDGGNGGKGGDAKDITTQMLLVSQTSGDYSDAFAAYSTGGSGGTAGSGGWLDGTSGNSGNAANGGDLDILLWDGFLSTEGYSSDGLVAQSIGGHSSDTKDCYALVCFGATGGSAGDAGDVSISLPVGFTSIDTKGDRSSGIVAYSIGGGGGDGNAAGDGGSSFAAFYAAGSKGGNGGHAGDVYITNSGTITTAGNDSIGIDAKSIGGSGGKGGAAGALGAFGARGGGASNGGSVTVYNWNRILAGKADPGAGDDPTVGENDVCGDGCSHGIFAQSVGGGGGHGGATTSIYPRIGATGSSGGDGGEVFVQTYGSGSITTFLDDSDAIYAHSIGGGGGSAGSQVQVEGGVSILVGGAGSKGGDGDKVTVNLLQFASLETYGDTSPGIDAMSLGGGGGHGAYAISVSASEYFGGSAAVGGDGGSAGDGGDVTITTDETGSITTEGDDSPGIDAHSVGGKGGKGGFAISLELGSSYLSGSVAVGGTGGGGGDGGMVAVTNGYRITTAGDDGHGIWAKSRGGGGGDGGMSIAGNVNVSAGVSVAVAVGGAGGDGGVGGEVVVSNTGVIGTNGDNAHGVFAHSVGGGGGTGGMSIAGDVNVGDGLAVAVAVGGAGGDGGVGGEVDVTNAGVVGTNGDDAHGVFAQSVGGGGGTGGMSIAGSISAGGDEWGGGTIDVSVGGSGGEGGVGGQTTVKNHKPITTTGEGARGIFAQSVGGGGGTGALAFSAGAQIANKNSAAVNVALGGAGGKGGNGGVVEVENYASITTGLPPVPADF